MIDKERIIRDVKWYIRYRTIIWSSLFFMIGFFGGNADRIASKIPTLRYSTPEVQQKLDTLEEIKETLKKIQEELDID